MFNGVLLEYIREYFPLISTAQTGRDICVVIPVGDKLSTTGSHIARHSFNNMFNIVGLDAGFDNNSLFSISNRFSK